MKIPKKVKIAGTTYKVVIVDRCDDENSYGKIVWTDSVIRLRKSLSDQALMLSFLHECMHAVDTHYFDCAIDKQFGEQGIDVMANALQQILPQIESS